MAYEFNLYKTCTRCEGTGIATVPNNGESQVTCFDCDGTGLLPTGVAVEVGDQKIETYKIVEATEDNEYAALTENQKDVYKMIISLGRTDFSEGTKVRAKLWNMFGEETTTRENLESL